MISPKNANFNKIELDSAILNLSFDILYFIIY